MGPGVRTTPMSTGFQYRRRVQFSETDLAGIAHFSAYFRFMEEAEHALWRAALSIGAAEQTGGWPRVSASFDYKSPLRFEDEFDVVVQIAETTRRSIRYAFTITLGNALVGTGTMTAVCTMKESGHLRAVDLPADVIARLRAAAAAGLTDGV
jgi:acyl-CoA thioester hydrolase